MIVVSLRSLSSFDLVFFILFFAVVGSPGLPGGSSFCLDYSFSFDIVSPWRYHSQTKQ